MTRTNYEDLHRAQELSADEWLRTVDLPLSTFFGVFSDSIVDVPDDLCRSNIQYRTNAVIKSYKSRFALFDGIAYCDATNNTPYIRDSLNVKLSIHLRPALTTSVFDVEIARFDPALGTSPHA